MHILLIFFLTLIIPFLVMPKMILDGRQSPYRIVLNATIVISAMATLVLMAAALSGVGLYAQMQDMVDVMSTEAAKNSAAIGAFDLAGISEEERAGMFQQVYSNALVVFPVSIMFTGAVVSYLVYLVLSRILSKRANVQRMSKFREFSFPHGAGTAVMFMYLTSWILTETGVLADAMFYANINVLFDLVFSLQGIAVVLMFCHLKRVPSAVGIIAVIVLWSTVFGEMMLILLGLFDLMIGIRSRMTGSNIR